MRAARLPWLTLAVVALALLAWASPAVGVALRYERWRVAEGDWWRLLTGSLAHWSASHVLLDAAAFAAGGALVERRGRARLALLCLVASVGVGVSVHLLAPELSRYAGLSGLAYATMTAAALDLARERGEGRLAGLLALGVLGAKLVLDLTSPGPLLVDARDGVVAAPVAHVAGVAVALVAVLGAGLGKSSKRLAETDG